MAGKLANVVRRERTSSELRRLSAAIAAWLEKRRRDDYDQTGSYVGRHKTQLETIERVLKGAADALAADARRLDTSMDAGDFCDRCRDLDMATVWLQRIWEFYREKFDQRDDPALRPILRSADEIVWSAYHPIMEQAAQRTPEVEHGAAPLAFIAPEYSPSAIESDRPLAGSLRLQIDFPGWDDELKALVASLPLPLLSLPTWCVHAPWWLIYIGHEVGHHVQGKLGLGGYFRDGIASAVATVLPDQSERWRAWGEEIFADVFSVLTLGRAAVWSIADVERTAASRMATPKAKYPAPAMRLQLLARTATRLGLAGDKELAGVDTSPALEAKLSQAADAVVAFSLAPLAAPLGKTLADFCGLAPEIDKAARAFDAKATFWAQRLRDAAPQPPLRDLFAARHIAAGSIAAWKTISAIEDEDARAKASDALSSATTQALQQCGPLGARGDKQPAPPEAGLSVELARRLTRIGEKQRKEGVEPHGISN